MHPTEENTNRHFIHPNREKLAQQLSRMVYWTGNPRKIASSHTQAAVSIASARMGTFAWRLPVSVIFHDAVIDGAFASRSGR